MLLKYFCKASFSDLSDIKSIMSCIESGTLLKGTSNFYDFGYLLCAVSILVFQTSDEFIKAF